MDELKLKTTRWLKLNIKNTRGVKLIFGNLQWAEICWDGFNSTDKDYNHTIKIVLSNPWNYLGYLDDILLCTLILKTFKGLEWVCKNTSNKNVCSGGGKIADSDFGPVGCKIWQNSCTKFTDIGFRCNFDSEVDSWYDFVILSAKNSSSNLEPFIRDGIFDVNLFAGLALIDILKVNESSLNKILGSILGTLEWIGRIRSQN